MRSVYPGHQAGVPGTKCTRRAETLSSVALTLKFGKFSLTALGVCVARIRRLKTARTTVRGLSQTEIGQLNALAAQSSLQRDVNTLKLDVPALLKGIAPLDQDLDMDVSFRLRKASTLHEYGFVAPAEGRSSLKEYFETEGSEVKDQVIFENDFLSGCEVKAPFIEALRFVHGKPIFSAARAETGVRMHRHNESWLAQLKGRKAKGKPSNGLTSASF